MNKVIGLDLGTTNSVVSVLENGKPKVITNSVGARTTPSIVGFTDKEKLVGQTAKNQQTTNPTNTVFSVKRYMGRRGKEVKEEKKTVPFKVVGKPGSAVKIDINGKEYSPPEISALILQNLRKSAEDYLGTKVESVVITVPAYFNDSQRKATQEAGVIAGLDVKRVLPEPTAAALAYGLDKTKEGKIAVFDLGGGTFDISILDIGEGVFETLSINGDTHLGGDDYDEALINYVADIFSKKENIDLRKDPMSHQRLKGACEEAKCELSTSVESSINLPFITADANGPKHLDQKVTRSKFEQITEHLTDRLKNPIKQAIKDSKLKISDISECILVGGSTRMPAVQQVCTDIFGKAPNKSVNPDEAVALGAAIQAGIISGDMKDILVLDVTPLSLGVETMGSVMTVMVPRNTTIPTSKKEVYSTAADGQPEVTIHVLQGERSMSIDNRTLGRFNLTDIPPAPRGVPQIEVNFDINADGILQVTAVDLGTKKQQDIRIEGSSGLSEEEVSKMKDDAEANAKSDKQRVELIQIKNQADSLIYSSEKIIKENDDKLDEESKQKLSSAVDELKESIKTDDITRIKESVDQVNNLSQAAGKAIYDKLKEAMSDKSSDDSIDGSVVDNKSDDVINDECDN